MHRPWSTSAGGGSLNCEPGDGDSNPSAERAALEARQQRPEEQPAEPLVPSSLPSSLPQRQRRGPDRRAASPEHRPEPGRQRSGHRPPQHRACTGPLPRCHRAAAAAPSAGPASSPAHRPEPARRQCEGRPKPQGEEQPPPLPQISILAAPWPRPAAAPAAAASPASQLEPGPLQCAAIRRHYYCPPHRLRHPP